MAEDPIKSTGGAPEERGPEQNPEQQENAQEFLARRSRQLKEMVEDIKRVGNPELDHALFARLEKIIADFDQTAPRILEQEGGDEEKAKSRIDQRFDSSKNDVMQTQEFLSRPVAEVGPEAGKEPFSEASAESPENLIDVSMELDDDLEVQDVVDSFIIVTPGATLKVLGVLKNSTINVETGGSIEVLGSNEGSDINPVEARYDEETRAHAREMRDRILKLQIGDVVFSNSGTKRKVLNVSPKGDGSVEVQFERITETGHKSTETLSYNEKMEVSKFLFINRILSAEEVVDEEIQASPGSVMSGAELESDDAEGDTFEEQIRNVGVSLREEPDDDFDDEDDEVEATTSSPREVKLEDLESELGYLHLEPNKIFENLDLAAMEQLRSQMMEFREAERNLEQARIELAREQGKKKANSEIINSLQQRVEELTALFSQKLETLNTFYREKISAVLTEQGKEDALDEEALQSVAERINAVVLDTIALEAQRNSIDSKAKGVLKQMLKNMPIMAGTALAIGSAGLALPITGVLVGGSSWILRRLLAAREKSKASDNRLKHREKVNEAKTASAERFFGDIESLRKQLSGHISNALRQETSQKAIERLQTIEAARDSGEIPLEVLDDVSKEFYFSALAQVEAKYPDLPQEQRQSMAIQMAMNLAQHQRNRSEAADRLAAIREQKPALYKLIEKYNLLASGRWDTPPEGMTEEEKRVWGVSKHDLLSLGVGASIGVAVRSSGIARAALGALSGGAIGYMIGEEIERKNQEKVFGEIKEMLEEAERLIVDLSLSPDQVSELRRSRDVVQARLEAGILDSNPLLKSRAENFIANFQRIELSGVSGVDALLTRIGQNTVHLQEQVEYDLSRIEKASKRAKLAATIGGTIVGAAAGFFGSDISKKALQEIGDTPLGEKIGLGGDDKPETPSTTWEDIKNLYDDEPTENPWKTEDDPLKEIVTGGQENAQANATEAGQTQVEPEAPPAPTKFTDTIDSSEVSGSDSIWKSTKAMFLRNAEDLGYKGDDAGLDKWAETQTANAVNELNKAQGGNLKDLVHDNDLVHLEKGDDGNWHLSVEEASGVESGHLSDTNVNKFFDGTRFEGDVEHTQAVDSRTGDQYWEIKSGEDVYKVYDWDRDGRPNVLMPDGSSAEMSVEEMKAFFQEKNIAFTEQEIDAAAAAQRFDQYTGGGGGQYESGMYQMAQGNSEQANALFKHVLESNDQSQIETYIKDDLQTHGFSPSKSQVFLALLKDGGDIDNTLNGAIDAGNENPTQTMDDLRSTFDSSVKTSYDALKGVDAKEWHPVKLGDRYFLAYKYHEGPFWPLRSDHFYLSDGSLDGSGSYVITEHLDDHAMKDFFEHGPGDSGSTPPDNVAPQETGQVSPEPTPQPSPAENTNAAEAPQSGNNTDFEPVKATETTPGSTPQTEAVSSPDQSYRDPQTDAALEKWVENASKEVHEYYNRVQSELRPGLIQGTMSEQDFLEKVQSLTSHKFSPEELADLSQTHKTIMETQNMGMRNSLVYKTVNDLVRMNEPSEVSVNVVPDSVSEEPKSIPTPESPSPQQPVAPKVETSPKTNGPMDLFDEAEAKDPQPEVSPDQPTQSPDASPEDLNAALSVLAKGFKVDSLTVEQIQAMDDPEQLAKMGSAINYLIDKVQGDPGQEHTLRGLHELHSVVDAKMVGFSSMDSALSSLSAGEKVVIKLADIKSMDDLKALEGLKGRAEDMVKVIREDQDLASQADGFEKVIAVIDKRITELKA